MKRRLLAIAILAIVFLLSSATTKVLIIGVGEFYDKRVTKLPGAITDVRAFRDAVVELGIAEQDNIQLLENPSLGILRIEISKFFSGADPQDKLIFYYGGHGQSKDTKTYFVPYDVDPSEIEKTCYNLTDNLTELLAKTKAKEIIMIMDMCYAGSLIEGRPLRDVKYELTPLEKLIKDLGVTMLLSSGASEISLEKKEGSGWFTYYLLKGLKEQAEKGKQEITLRELFEYVKDKVSKETDRQQNPVLIGKGDIKLPIHMRGTCMLKIIAGNELAKTGTVYLNGQEIGKLTSGIIAKIDLPKGKYTITVDSEKMEKWERQVEFKSDYDMQEVKVEAQIATRPVRVITEPMGAKVWIDGKEVGMSPWQGKIEIGKMTEVKAWAEGYRTEKKEINIPAKGELIEVKIPLKKNSPPNQPVLLEPHDNENNISVLDKVFLKWKESEDPDGDNVSYDVYISTDQNLKLVATGLKNLEYPLEMLEFGKTYYWKIVSKDTNGAQSESVIRKFKIEKNLPPQTPKLSEPTDGEQITPHEIVLRWEKSEDSEKDEVVYDVYFGQQGNLKLIASNLKALEYSIKDLETSKTYEWKVIAKDNYVAQSESKLQRFSTVPWALKWRFQTGGSIGSSPAIGADGTIYVGSNDGNLYAIASDSKGLANSPWPKFRGNLRNTGRFGDK